MQTFRLTLISVLIITILAGCQTPAATQTPTFVPGIFDGQRAYQDVIAQVDFGPRYSGSQGHAQLRQWIVDSLAAAGWQAKILEEDFNGQAVYNIEACRGMDSAAEVGYILVGAHYDTRMYADNDPDLASRSEPVLGANDGASGVAVLLELARALPQVLPTPVCLVFFDAEDNGRIAEWEWAVGSQLYAEQMDLYPRAVVIVDMVGDADQTLLLEQNSDAALAAEIWETAARLGVETFIAEPGPRLLDDHTAFLRLGIPAVDIIDFTYSYWHTVEDTAEKVSAQSLQNVGDVLLAWLLEE